LISRYATHHSWARHRQLIVEIRAERTALVSSWIGHSSRGAGTFTHNSLPLTIDDQGYVVQFTRLIASKAMTDSVAAASLKCSIAN
jgi:hypothetical protein